MLLDIEAALMIQVLDAAAEGIFTDVTNTLIDYGNGGWRGVVAFYVNTPDARIGATTLCTPLPKLRFVKSPVIAPPWAAFFS